MINSSTTNVSVRVDLPSMRAIVVTDDAIVSRPGQPVFNVAANFNKLEYYIVEKNAAATYGVTVRPATAAERAVIDAQAADALALSITKSKEVKVIAIRDFYVGAFAKRFKGRGFIDQAESDAVVAYSGTDTHVLNDLKPLADKIGNAGIEWRHTVCQPVIDAMLADATGNNVILDDAYRSEVEGTLDTFLTERQFDIAIFKR